MASHRGGRPQSRVRRYFTFISTNQAKCDIKNNEGKICGKDVNGAKYPSNLKAHLDNYHKDIAKLVNEEVQNYSKSQRSSTSTSSSSTHNEQEQTLPAFFSARRPYSKNSMEFAKKSKALSLFLGGTNVPISIVEDQLFKDFVNAMDSRFELPGRKKVTQMVFNRRLEIEKRIKGLLSDSKFVSITTDIWTKCDNTPFIGMTVHFYHRNNKKRYDIFLALKEFSGSHTGLAIYDKILGILSLWDIDIQKVFKAVTDNASNMVASFRDGPSAGYDEQGGNHVEYFGLEDIVDVEGEDGYQSDIDSEPDDGPAYSQVDETILDSLDIQFDALQEIHHGTLTSKHVRCIVHSLQLIVRKFEKEAGTASILKAAVTLVSIIRKSTILTAKLRKLSGGLTLRAHNVTRWASLYRLIERLIELQDSIIRICQQENLDGLLPSQWNSLKQIKRLLEPFSQHTLILEAYKTTTISMVIPAVIDLENHLKKMVREGVCKNGADLMLKDLRERFSRYLDTESTLFDPTFVIATALDARYKNILSVDQKKAAKQQLISELIQRQSTVITELPIGGLDDESGEPVCSKRCRNLVVNRNQTVSPSSKALEDEITNYMDNDLTQLNEDSDPLDFWKHKTAYPRLADYAVDLLVVPCSSAASETLFSFAGMLSKDAKSRISANNLENQVLIKSNKHLLNI